MSQALTNSPGSVRHIFVGGAELAPVSQTFSSWEMEYSVDFLGEL